MQTLTPTGWTVVAAVLVLWAGWQVTTARLWPWAPCRHCKGGRHLNNGGKGPHWRLCRRCKGKGAHLRLLYRVVWQRGKGHPAAPR